MIFLEPCKDNKAAFDKALTHIGTRSDKKRSKIQEELLEAETEGHQISAEIECDEERFTKYCYVFYRIFDYQ